MLKKRNQSNRDFILKNSDKSKTIEWLVFCQGKGEWGIDYKGAPWGNSEEFLLFNSDCGDGYMTPCICQNEQNFILKKLYVNFKIN